MYDWFAFFGGHPECLTASTSETCMRFSLILAVTNRDLQHAKLRIYDWFAFFEGHLDGLTARTFEACT